MKSEKDLIAAIDENVVINCNGAARGWWSGRWPPIQGHVLMRPKGPVGQVAFRQLRCSLGSQCFARDVSVLANCDVDALVASVVKHNGCGEIAGFCCVGRVQGRSHAAACGAEEERERRNNRDFDLLFRAVGR